jgi:hypothetical protein
MLLSTIYSRTRLAFVCQLVERRGDVGRASSPLPLSALGHTRSPSSTKIRATSNSSPNDSSNRLAWTLRRKCENHNPPASGLVSMCFHCPSSPARRTLKRSLASPHWPLRAVHCSSQSLATRRIYVATLTLQVMKQTVVVCAAME